MLEIPLAQVIGIAMTSLRVRLRLAWESGLGYKEVDVRDAWRKSVC